MIKAIFWIGVGYGFGVFAFSIAAIADSGLGTDAVGSIIDGVGSGLIWPVTFIDLVTGSTGP